MGHHSINVKAAGGLCFLLLFCLPAVAQVFETLYINSGIYVAVDSAQFDYCAFNDSPVFSPDNKRIIIQAGDDLELTVINADSVSHGFAIKGKTPAVTILPGDTAVVTASFSAVDQAFIYYDPTDYPRMTALGLAGIIHVHDGTPASAFYWNLKEYKKDWAALHRQQLSVDWTEYYPDYFTVNGRSNPHINGDPAARVTGNVGETIHIVVANTGQSSHSLHFHGYHSEIIYSSAHPNHTGRSKDTFPVESLEVLILEMIPDKTGEYPVHDHNLVAVSAGGIYPNGMFLTMLIQ